MALWQWSTTAASNASVGLINWAEGQPSSTVNDSARQMMADVAAWFAAAEWLNYGLTPTYTGATTFTVAGNQTLTYYDARRVRASVTAGTIYGTITSSVYTSLTTVTVQWDSGSLDSGLSEVDVHIVNPGLHANFALQSLTLNSPGNENSTLKLSAPMNTKGANIELIGNGSTTPNKYLRAFNGIFYLMNSAYSAALMTIDDSGNMKASGNIEVSTAGSGLQVKEGSNAKQGVAMLVNGTVVVPNTAITANSRVFITAQDNSSQGALRVSTRTAGVSFAIASSNTNDSGVVAYEIFEPGA